VNPLELADVIEEAARNRLQGSIMSTKNTLSWNSPDFPKDSRTSTRCRKPTVTRTALITACMKNRSRRMATFTAPVYRDFSLAAAVF
jgi:hypothetical protein